MKKKIIPSNEAYVYWFYNKYNFKTYIGSRARYEGSYKDDFMINYNSSSEDEEFLRALENGELVGEVIAVFIGETYEEVKYRAFVYEQILIYLLWSELGAENSYNHMCWYNGHICSNPFNREYAKGEDSPFWKDIDMDEVKRLSSEEHLTLDEIAEIIGVGAQTIKTRCNDIGFEYYKKDHNKSNNGRYIDIEFDKILELHEKGLSTGQIGKILGFDSALILTRLKWNGLKGNQIDYSGDKNPAHGTTWVTNGIEEKFMHSKEEAEMFLDRNPDWRTGQSDEHKRKNGEANIGNKGSAGMVFVTNGEQNKFVKKEEVEEFLVNNNEYRTGVTKKPSYIYKIDREKLYDLYITQDKSINECAEIFGVKRKVILNRTKYYGFYVKKPYKLRYQIDKDVLYDLYVTQKLSIKECGERLQCDPRIIKDRIKRFNISR